MPFCGAQPGDEKLAPYYPTPETIVDKMLKLGGLKAGEKMFDLGSGDGRIVIVAAQKFHAEAVGVELDKDLVKQSTARILKLGFEKNAHMVNGDLLKQNYSSADLVTVYLLPDAVNNKVQPLLDKQLKKGARIVAKDFDFRELDAGKGREHRRRRRRPEPHSLSVPEVDVLFLSQLAWPRRLGWVRVLLAAISPVVAYLFMPGDVAPMFYGVMGLYLVYALVVALRGRSYTGMMGLLALFGDTVFFLIMANYGADRMLWLASAFYLFLLGEALTFYSTVEVGVIVGCVRTVFRVAAV